MVRLQLQLPQTQPSPSPLPVSNFDTLKAFFHYSVTIFLARSTALLGFILTVVGAMDWSPLTAFDYTTDFKPRQLIGVGIATFIKGLVDEVGRRRTLNT